MFFYSDTGPKSDFKGDLWKMDACKIYLSHFSNFLFLNFMLKNGTWLEVQQATKELEICEKKLVFWKKHPNYEDTVVTKEKERMIKEWKS